MSAAASIQVLHTQLARVADESALREFDALLASLRRDWTLDAFLTSF
jgi:hypothetical protein